MATRIAVGQRTANTGTAVRKRRVTFNTKAHRARPFRLGEVAIARYEPMEDSWLEMDGRVDGQLLDPMFDEFDCDPAELLGFRISYDD